jgi:hypothetical protein
MINFLKKYHKWLSIIFAILIIAFAISGIILNHREGFSSIDINRKYLPQEYKYKNWNNAAITGSLRINPDSVLIYGNIGIWLTDTNFNKYTDFNRGFPQGIDNRKIAKIIKLSSGEIYAGSYFGLFKFDRTSKKWKQIDLHIPEQRIVDLMEKENKLFVLTRSQLLTTNSNSNFEIINIPPPENYDNKIGLFKTLWVIHSGEVYGFIGKLIVDLVAIIFIFLTITGIIIFINKYRIKARKKTKKTNVNIIKTNRWNLKWHNKIGWTTVILLIITTSTGIFLRPPLLAIIGNTRVEKIRFTELDSPNPWFDILRRITYNETDKIYIISTMDAFYYSDDEFATSLKIFPNQPPASVMGVTVLEKFHESTYLVGSFEGLFLWNYRNGMVFDYIKKQPWQAPKTVGAPIGDFKISGFSKDFQNQEIIFEYGMGAINLASPLLPSPMTNEIIEASPMSLWNFSLEVHTARIYQPIFGVFYILIIPISGLAILFILISGTIVWYKRHRK